jgi:hypothetical protein
MKGVLYWYFRGARRDHFERLLADLEGSGLTRTNAGTGRITYLDGFGNQVDTTADPHPG